MAEQLTKLESLLLNTFSLTRQQFLARQRPDARRDYDRECGHPKPEELTPEFYQDLYDRDAIASRIVEVLPEETWKVQPTVYENEDAEVVTPFEEAWDTLGQSLRGDSSHFRQEEGSPIWDYLKRAEIAARICQYGVILFGLDDGLDLSQPAKGVSELYSAPTGMDSEGKPLPMPSINGVYSLTVNAKEIGKRRLLFLRVFPQALAEINRYEANPTSPRFGQPVSYRLTFSDPNLGPSGEMQPTALREVHWTRVLHLTGKLLSSETHAVPELQQPLNRVLDLQKLYGGSAEMYWQGGLSGHVFAADVDTEIDVAATKDEIEKRLHGLQRDLLLRGLTPHTLAPQVVDPRAQIECQIDAICIQKAFPKRIFMGSERGELSSAQDSDEWGGRLRGHRRNYTTPRVIVPFVDRCILLGLLPVPPTGYCVDWPDEQAKSENEQASVAVQRTDALAKYVAGSVESVMPPMDFLTRILGYTEEEAEQILESASQYVAGQDVSDGDDAQQQQQDAMDQQDTPKEAPMNGQA